MGTISTLTAGFPLIAAAIGLGLLLVIGGVLLVWSRQRSSQGVVSGKPPIEPGGSTQTLLVQTLELNAKLERRLSDVESRLHEHTENITDFMTEARTDGLTGLANRRAFDDELNRRLSAWRQHRQPLLIGLLDIDFFKKFNDRYGHLAGDAVLSTVARALTHTARDGDLVGRLGGEEFAVLFAARSAEEGAQAIERMRKVVEKTDASFEGQLLRVTTSCGLAMAGAESTPSELLKHADLALYAAKADGRNCSHFHDGVRSKRITLEAAGPASPSVTDPGSGFVQEAPPLPKTGLSNLMVELSRDLRHRLDELTRV